MNVSLWHSLIKLCFYILILSPAQPLKSLGFYYFPSGSASERQTEITETPLEWQGIGTFLRRPVRASWLQPELSPAQTWSSVKDGRQRPSMLSSLSDRLSITQEGMKLLMLSHIFWIEEEEKNRGKLRGRTVAKNGVKSKEETGITNI